MAISVQLWEQIRIETQKFFEKITDSFTFRKSELISFWDREDIKTDLKDIWTHLDWPNKSDHHIPNFTLDEILTQIRPFFNHEWTSLSDDKLLSLLKYYRSKVNPIWTILQEKYNSLINKIENYQNDTSTKIVDKMLPVFYSEDKNGIKTIDLIFQSNYDFNISMTPEGDFAYTFALSFLNKENDYILQINSSCLNILQENFLDLKSDFLKKWEFLNNLLNSEKVKWITLDFFSILDNETDFKFKFINPETIFPNFKNILEKLETAYETYIILTNKDRAEKEDYLYFDRFRADGTLIQPTSRSTPFTPSCGQHHYSWTSYWNHRSAHNPNWKDRTIEPWVLADFGGFYKSVCMFCQGVETHNSSCQTLIPDWFPTTSPPASGMGSSVLSATFGGYRSDGFQPSQQYETEQQKLLEEKKKHYEELKKKEEAELKKLNDTINKWSEEWKVYLETGKGVEVFNEFSFFDFANKEVKWTDPLVYNLVISTDGNILFGAKKKPVNNLNFNLAVPCIKGAMDENKEYWKLINEKITEKKDKTIQLLAEKKEDVIYDETSKILKIQNYFHLRPYQAIISRNWKQYWEQVKKIYSKFPNLDLAKGKLEHQKKRIKAETSYDSLRKQDILEQIDIVIGTKIIIDKGYLDELLDMKDILARSDMKDLVIDRNFFILNKKPIDFNKFPLLNQGRIILKEFKDLENINIQNKLWFLDQESTILFEEIDLSKTAPNLKSLKCEDCKNLQTIKLGNKWKLETLDIRNTSVNELDLTNTNITSIDYDTDKMPIRVEDEIVEPFATILQGRITFSNPKKTITTLIKKWEKELLTCIDNPDSWQQSQAIKLACPADKVFVTYALKWLNKIKEFNRNTATYFHIIQELNNLYQRIDDKEDIKDNLGNHKSITIGILETIRETEKKIEKP